MKPGITLSAAMLLLVFQISACYTHGHSARDYGTLGYQFDEPREYCRHSRAGFGFEMYCPEGRIIVEFAIPPSGVTAYDMFADLVDGMPDSSKYLLSELDGNTSRIYLAELDRKFFRQDDYPTYIAVFPFDTERIVIAKGFLYKAEFEDQFKPTFRILIETLEPYSGKQ